MHLMGIVSAHHTEMRGKHTRWRDHYNVQCMVTGPVFAEERRRVAVACLLGSPDLPPALPPAVDDAAAIDLHVAARAPHPVRY